MSELDDTEKLKRRQAIDNLRRRREVADVALVLATVEGRRFFWRMLGECGLFKSSFTGNNTTFFNEGMRQVGLTMMADLEQADPSAYLKMLEESRIEEQKQK